MLHRLSSRFENICSDCSAILKYLLLDGSLHFDWQKDGVVISRSPSRFTTSVSGTSVRTPYIHGRVAQIR